MISSTTHRLVPAGCLAAALATLLACAGPSTSELAVERGEIALSLGNAADAADAYQTALALEPQDSKARHGLARAYAARGESERALAILQGLEHLDPAYFDEYAREDYAFALYQAAKERLHRGDPSGALRFLQRLEEADPDHAGLHQLMPRALVAEAGRLQVSGRPDEAIAVYERAVGEPV